MTSIRTVLKAFILSMILLFITLGCSDESPPISTYIDIDIVTGLLLFDDNGAAIGKLGNPNHKPGELFVFPIPATSSAFINSPNNISSVWLVKADCLAPDPDIEIEQVSKNLTFTVEEISSNASKELELDEPSKNLQLNLTDFDKGFYKLFCQLESGDVDWYNIYIDPTVNNIPDLTFYNGCM